MSSKAFLISALLAGAAIASPPHRLRRRQASNNSTFPPVAQATYDGQCYYPKPTDDFDLEDYLGRWYQVAGTEAPFTAGCKCIFAEYALNDNGTVSVSNGCELEGREITIQGTATPVPSRAGYGNQGVLRVQFPGQPPPDCPGPNYIVQDIAWGDEDEYSNCKTEYPGSFAIVQASNFSTLFLLSREQNVENATIDAWLERARRQGTDLSNVIKTDQTECQFT